MPSDPFDFALFPNPSNGQEVQIRGVMPGRQPVSLRIIDALGRIVQDQVLAVQPNGQLIQSLQVGTLSPGTYLISLRQTTQRTSKTLVVLR